MKVTKFGYDVACERRPSVHPLHVTRCQLSGYFGRKSVWPPSSCEAETTKESIKTKTESGNCFCILLSKALSLDLLSCPQIWKIEKEKDREQKKVRRQASEAQREKELERDRKNKGDIFCWRNNMKFCSGGEKMRNASGHLGENERQ